MRLTNMRAMRKEAGISQTALARKIGSGQRFMSQVENGLPTTEATAKRIADGLGCEVADLIEPTVTLRVSEIPPRLLTALTKQ